MPEDRFTPKRVQSAIDRINGRVTEIPVDVVDRGDEYVVEADVPGYTTQNLDVTVRPRVVRIVATPDRSTPRGVRGRDDRGVRRRLVQLPDPVREKTASASYHRGVLRITVSKADRDATDVRVE
ncbi:MAG: Hsp20/alpha crystallin family protein [Halanaeroarchaeum sp.]